MAIDTAEKRRSAAGVAFWVVGPGVTPNLAKDVEWRAESAWSYSGVAPAPPVPGAGAVDELFTLGTKESLSVTQQPTLGGRFSW
jgi:hypothetical protein